MQYQQTELLITGHVAKVTRDDLDDAIGAAGDVLGRPVIEFIR